MNQIDAYVLFETSKLEEQLRRQRGGQIALLRAQQPREDLGPRRGPAMLLARLLIHVGRAMQRAAGSTPVDERPLPPRRKPQPSQGEPYALSSQQRRTLREGREVARSR